MCQFVFNVSSLYHGEWKATDSPQPIVPCSSFASSNKKSLFVNVPKLVVKGAFSFICKCLIVISVIFMIACLQVLMCLFVQKYIHSTLPAAASEQLRSPLQIMLGKLLSQLIASASHAADSKPLIVGNPLEQVKHKQAS